ncbi:formate--phosphoribosylaminoimidazolecarboxamide ligase family protein [Candidatus Micrarchaeota archaeon]|nr:formate--phosphoribosylaminoimidazolecarboxamide ligase family protein [Candidatus Micrarchaeota archaeon]
MLKREDVQAVAAGYNDVTIGVLGSHSALDVCQGAKAFGLKTLVVCQKGREKTYEKYYRVRKAGERTLGVIDEILLLDKFKDITRAGVQEKLRAKNVVFVPHRSFAVYVGFDAIENEFKVPLFGSRSLLRTEERNAPKNQYYLLEKAGIRTPKQIKKPEEIDRLVIVKASEAKRSYERAFFFASNLREYEEEKKKLIESGTATKEGIENAVIEEVILGAHVNLNFFYSPLNKELELIGTDFRRQTNLDGLLRLQARDQLKIPSSVRINNIEVGHVACTLRESLLEKAFEIGEKFVEAAKREYAPGIIGPFALQGAIASEEKGEEFVIFDISPRVPGSPGTRFTPYTEYLYGESLSVGKRIALEAKNALKEERLKEVVT